MAQGSPTRKPTPWADRGPLPANPFELHACFKVHATEALLDVLDGIWPGIERDAQANAIAHAHSRSARLESELAVGMARRASSLRHRLRQALEQEADAWLDPATEDVERDGKLGLMSDDELCVLLASQAATETLERRLGALLYELDARLNSLALACRVPPGRSNPWRPAAVVRAFSGIHRVDDWNEGLAQRVFAAFADKAAPTLEGIYRDFTQALRSSGYRAHVGPGHAADAPVPPIAAPPPTAPAAGGGWVPDGGMVEARTEAPALWQGGRTAVASSMSMPMPGPQAPRYRDGVHQRLVAWRERQDVAGGQFGAPSPASAGFEPATASASDTALPASPSQHARRDGTARPSPLRRIDQSELVGVIQLMQGDAPAAVVRALREREHVLPGLLRDELLSASRQLGFDPERTGFAAGEEDAIDLVALLFQGLADNTRLLQRGAELMARLLLATLRMTMQDDALFNRERHPARRLIEAVAEACDGNAGDNRLDAEVFERAETTVAHVAGQEWLDAAILELSANELRDFLDQMRERSEAATRRAAEALHGRERLHVAREAAHRGLAALLLQPLSADVARFLQEPWRHALVQAHLRHGADSDPCRAVEALGRRLVQLDADAAALRGHAVADGLLQSQAGLAECFRLNGMDESAAGDALARLVAALARPSQPRSLQPLPPPPVADQPESALSPGLQLAHAAAATALDAGLLARLRRLRVGQLLRLTDDDGAESNYRIAWISPLTSRYLVADRRATRRIVLTAEDLARLAGAGRLKVRAAGSPFDAAIKGMWQALHPDEAA